MARNKKSSFNAAAGFEYKENTTTAVETKEKPPVMEESTQRIINVTDKSTVGRPKNPGYIDSKVISARLTKENYEKARIAGGKYGGITAYLNYLIEKDA